MIKHKTLPLKECKNYVLITHDYNPNSPKDMELLDKAMADLKGVTFVLTENFGKIAIARLKSEVKGL